MSFQRTGDSTTRSILQGSFGMSASTHWLATATAQSVPERDGNAFDAAAAAAFVLRVVDCWGNIISATPSGGWRQPEGFTGLRRRSLK